MTRLVLIMLSMSGIFGYVSSCCEDDKTISVIISKRKGAKDVPGCGTLSKPCSTINNAFKYANKTNKLKLLLDGGSEETSYVYSLKATLNANMNLTVSQWKGSKIIPRIKSSPPIYFVKSTRKEMQQLQFQNLVFDRTPIVSIANTRVQIIIKNCEVLDSPSPVLETSIKTLLNLTVDMANVKMFKCKALSRIEYLDRGQFIITNCIFTADIGSISYTGFNLSNVTSFLSFQINYSTFENISNPVNANLTHKSCDLNSTFGKFTSEKTIYKKSKNPIKIAGCVTVYFSDCQFNESQKGAMELLETRVVHLKGLNFSNNYHRSAVTVIKIVDQVYIERCFFLNNSDRYQGGALFSYESEITLHNCKFINNSAPIFGGTIYNTGDSLGKHELDMENVTIVSKPGRSSRSGTLVYSPQKVKLENTLLIVGNDNVTESSYIDGIVSNYGIIVVKESFVFKFTCPVNRFPEIVQFNSTSRAGIPVTVEGIQTFGCRKCPRPTYNLKPSSVVSPKLIEENVKCLACPNGGNCTDGLVSQYNFWGYRNEKDEVQFLPCPSSYCCSKESVSCNSYNTCGTNRKGVLCGSCIDDFTLSFFNEKCENPASCKKLLFWAFYVLYSTVFVFLFLYLEDCGAIIKKLWAKVKSRRDKTKKHHKGKQPSKICDSEDDDISSVCTTDQDLVCPDNPLNIGEEEITASLIDVDFEDNDNDDMLTQSQQYDDVDEGGIRRKNSILDTSINESTKSNTDISRGLSDNLTGTERKWSDSFFKNNRNTNTSEVEGLFSKSRRGSHGSTDKRFVNSISIEEQFEKISDTLKTPHETEETQSQRENVSTSETVLGLAKIVFFFYQTVILFRVNSSLENEYGLLNNLKFVFLSFFNFKTESQTSIFASLCPTKAMGWKMKQLLKVMSTFVCFLVASVLYIVAIFFKMRAIYKRDREEKMSKSKRNKNNPSIQNAPLLFGGMPSKAGTGFSNRLNYALSTSPTLFQLRVKKCFVHIVLFSYSNIADFCFLMINCVNILGERRLYHHGDTLCGIWWQYFIYIFLAAWTIPFPLAVKYGVEMLRQKRISLKKFYSLLAFPWLCLFFFVRTSCNRSSKRVIFSMDQQLEMKSIMKAFSGPFREEKIGENEHGPINWEFAILVRRLLLSLLCNMFLNPIARLFLTFPFLVLILILQIYYKPYKRSLLNWLEKISLSLLLWFNATHLFWAFTYMNDISDMLGFKVLAVIFGTVQDIILGVPAFVILFAVVLLFVRKTCPSCFGLCKMKDPKEEENLEINEE